MKYYNFETRIKSLKDVLIEYLKGNNIYYEVSGVYNSWYFEILTDPVGATIIDQFIESCEVAI